ncbi:MAG: hypothetical protein ABUS51_04905 [Acidobacteriota bacterium]
MAAGLKEIITQLEQQRDAIERALSALRDVDENSGAGPRSAVATASTGTAAKKKRKGGMSPEGKQRLIAALKARWAAQKAGVATEKATVKKVPGKRGRPKKTA